MLRASEHSGAGAVLWLCCERIATAHYYWSISDKTPPPLS